MYTNGSALRSELVDSIHAGAKHSGSAPAYVRIIQMVAFVCHMKAVKCSHAIARQFESQGRLMAALEHSTNTKQLFSSPEWKVAIESSEW